MEHRDDWIRELERRQDNIDPIRRIPNGALFQGALINGSLRLNKRQRAGALFLGLCGLATGCFFAVTAIAQFRDGGLPDPSYAFFCPFSVWIGWKTTKNALINNPPKHDAEKTETHH
jgi:hypothetical protein